jgi:hypothetical protein
MRIGEIATYLLFAGAGAVFGYCVTGFVIRIVAVIRFLRKGL